MRSLAIFSVIAGHFWALNTPYRRVDFDGSVSMFVQGMGYFFFGIGVPLFLLMTGYLNERKVTLDGKYLRGMARVLSGRPLLQVAGGSSGILGTIQAVAVFLLVYRQDVKGRMLEWTFKRVALLSLDIYLCCYAIDQLVYPFFLSHFYQSQQQFGAWFFVIVPMVLLLSAGVAQVKEWIFKLIKL